MASPSARDYGVPSTGPPGLHTGRPVQRGPCEWSSAAPQSAARYRWCWWTRSTRGAQQTRSETPSPRTWVTRAQTILDKVNTDVCVQYVQWGSEKVPLAEFLHDCSVISCLPSVCEEEHGPSCDSCRGTAHLDTRAMPRCSAPAPEPRAKPPPLAFHIKKC